MKFTPSIKFLLAAKASSKVIERKIYFRKTTDLSEALTVNNWIDATRFFDSIPDAKTNIEYDLGQFTSDAIQLVAKNIAWMYANVLNATEAQYIECKIEFKIGLDSSDLAGDVVYYFSGYIDKDTLFSVESSDTVQFTVDSGDSLMTKLPSEVIITQYFDGLQQALILYRTPGIYVSSTNVSGYELGAGVHTISYDYNEGNPQAQLNEGAWVQLTADGTYTLGDGKTNTEDKQRVTIKVVFLQLSNQSETLSEDIIIESVPQNLPKTWYTGVSIKKFAERIYNQIGISNIASGSMEINTFDGIEKRVSFLDHALKNETLANTGANYGIVYKSTTEIFFSTGNRVYVFNPQTNVTTYKFSVTAGKTISRLLYNSRNNHLWVVYGSMNGYGMYGDYIVRYDVATSTAQIPINIPSLMPMTVEPFDFVKYGGGYEYSLLILSDYAGSILRVDGTTMALTTLFTGTDLGSNPIAGTVYQKTSGGIVRFRFRTYDGIMVKWWEVNWNTGVAGTWNNGGVKNTWPPDSFPTLNAVYNSIDDKIYCESGAWIIKYDAEYSGGSVQSYTIVEDFHWAYSPTDNRAAALFFTGAEIIYSTQRDRQLRLVTSATLRIEKTILFCDGAPFTIGNSRVYGIDNGGRIFQLGTQVERYVDRCIFTEQKIKESLTTALRATNCISTMSFAKSAILYPRNDAVGDPVTSGNTIDVTVSNINDIKKNDVYGKAYDIIALENGIEKINYDGTNYNVLPQSITQRILTIQNSLIPTNVLKDYCKNFYDFYKTKRTLLTLPVLQSLFHIEPMDGVNANLTTTKIETIATDAPIYAATYKGEGTMEIAVLMND
jgi:hypothetical protein